MRASSTLVSAAILVAAVFSFSLAHGQEVDECSTPDTAILDVILITDTITVADDITIGELEIYVDITHTFVGDLDITVESAEATSVMLLDSVGLGSDDLLVTFSQLGIPHASDVMTCDCDMQPSGPGELFDTVGESSEGDWILSVEDTLLGDEGTLDEWCVIVFEETPIYGVKDLTATATDEEGVADVTWENTIDYDDIDVYINGEYEETLTGPFDQGDTESYSTPVLKVPQTPASICLVPIVDMTDGFEECDTTLLIEILDIFACSTASLEVPADFTINTSDLEVTDESWIEGIEVQLEVTTIFNGWNLTMDSPEGTNITLNNGLGDGLDILVLFSDDGSPPPGDGYGGGNLIQPTGPGALADFIGEETNGTWSLNMSTFDGGTMSSWCVNIDECPVAPPIDLGCEVDGDDVDLFWTNGADYDSILVLLDGELLESIGGDETTYLDEDAESGRRRYSVRGFSDADDCGLMSNDCVASPGIEESCATTDVTIAADQSQSRSPILIKTEVTLDNYFDVYVDVTSSDSTTGSMDLLLTSPTGTVVVLQDNQPGGVGFDLYFRDDGLPNDGTVGRLAPGAVVAPSGPGTLGDFLGENSYGTWNLDAHSFAGGTINEWCIGYSTVCDTELPTDASCTVDGLSVTVDWANGATYDDIEVLRNGSLVAELDGGDETFTENVVAGTYIYRVVGILDDCRASSQSCIAEVGLIEECSDDDVVLPDTGEFLDTIVTFDDVPVTLADVEIQIRFTDTIDGATLESPDGTIVDILGAVLADCTVSDNVRYDIAGIVGSRSCGGCRVAPVTPGSMADFAGDTAEGDWTISAGSFLAATMDDYCIRLFEACDTSAPSDFTCVDDPDGAILEWTNESTYGYVCIIRLSGPEEAHLSPKDAPLSARIAELDGDDSTFTDKSAGLGRHRYFLEVYDDEVDCVVLSEECLIAIGRTDECADPDTVVEADFILVEFTLEFPDDDDIVIGDSEVYIDATATFTDSNHFITSPASTEVQLHNAAGGGADFDVWFGDEGAGRFPLPPLACGGCLVQPSGPGTMADFAGEDAPGTWTYGVQAFSATTVNSWCVGIYPEIDAPAGFYRGDVSGNGSVSALLDALFLLNFGFNGGETPGCFDAADTDDNGTVSFLVDGLFLLLWMFDGGPEPPDPGVDGCGPDPTDDLTGCEEPTC